ncbi:YdcF family protein [Peteryoungia ipomoeae]|uniref:YdcF family protein n=1 Tax=Peteryoungia ipomoeae TaxID=1210932 RepID=A0A4S8P3Z4_9HYPH|nr:YdcF family protein [Peteryoungia ipomoeae]THV24135.1 YdcF family protein [Peteryoungia ipomoeae]
MFVVSKLFWLAVQPLSLAFATVLLSVLLIAFNRRRAALLSLSLSLTILFVTLYTTTGSVLLQGLEARFPKPSADPSEMSCMIVLGGAFETEVTTTRGGIELNQSADRFVEALRLAKAYPAARLLVSGGDGSLSGRFEGDAVVSRRFFETFGISGSRLIEDRTSRNTDENAANTKGLLSAEGLTDCLLVTSAFHMPRSVGLFRKQGLIVTPWPADYRTSGDVALTLDFTQPTLNAQQTATAVREWVGLFSYWLLGRIDELYPSP